MADFQIRILAHDNQEKGDLFTRLLGAYFQSLGYDRFRFNVKKTGREVDVLAVHKTESRRLVSECKAWDKPVGGSVLNKFAGVLEAERLNSANGGTLVGYVISLSGFTETAVQQELDLPLQRFVLVDGPGVAKQLVDGRIVVPLEKAAERAGQCMAEMPQDLQLDSEVELIAHPLGWVWCLFFTQNAQRKAFSLIHADGEVLAPQ